MHQTVDGAPRWMIEYARRIHHVRNALAYSGGTHDEWDVASGIQAGTFQMFCAPDSIAITELIEYPQGKDCHVFLAGGNLDELKQVIEQIERFAKSQQCRRVTLTGRRGWERSFLRERAYAPKWIVMAKELGVSDEQRRGEADHNDAEHDSAVGVGRGES